MSMAHEALLFNRVQHWKARAIAAEAREADAIIQSRLTEAELALRAPGIAAEIAKRRAERQEAENARLEAENTKLRAFRGALVLIATGGFKGDKCRQIARKAFAIERREDKEPQT